MRNRLFIATGTDYERGVQIGRGLKQEILVNYANQINYYRDTKNSDYAEWVAKCNMFLPFMEEHAPRALDELKGMAAGANVDLSVILAMTTAYERSFKLHELAEKCTAFAVTGKATKDKGVIFGQTNDERASEWLPDMSRVIHHCDQNGRQALIYTHPGILAYMGMNDVGLGVGWTYIDNGERQLGVPTNAIIREILHMRTLEEAVAYLQKIPHCIPNNFVIAHETEGICFVECFPSGVYVTKNDISLSHSNHILTEEMMEKDVARTGAIVVSTTFNRRRRMQELLDENIGKIDVEMAKRFQADHDGAPHSICVHGRECAPQLKTLAAMIFDLKAKEMHIAFGNACETPYQKYVFA